MAAGKIEDNTRPSSSVPYTYIYFLLRFEICWWVSYSYWHVAVFWSSNRSGEVLVAVSVLLSFCFRKAMEDVRGLVALNLISGELCVLTQPPPPPPPLATFLVVIGGAIMLHTGRCTGQRFLCLTFTHTVLHCCPAFQLHLCWYLPHCSLSNPWRLLPAMLLGCNFFTIFFYSSRLYYWRALRSSIHWRRQS